MPMFSNLNDAKDRDANDPLSGYRSLFFHPDPDLIYMDGNSLGKLPIASRDTLSNLIDRQWGDRLIRSWNEGWLDMPQRIGEKISSLIGAAPSEVIVADSTSVNLFKLIVASLTHQAPRKKILTDSLNFPSDIYIIQGTIKMLNQNHSLIMIPSEDEIHGPEEDIIEAMDENTALLTLSHTVFKSGYTYDIEKLTSKAHEKGIMVLWDLSHSVGALPIHLNTHYIDMAVGCTYKYLNGGPGAPAFLYVNERISHTLGNPISGWMGQKDLFDFSTNYTPTADISQFLTGTPPILSLAPIEKGVDIILDAGIDKLREKSLAQTQYLIDLWEQILKPLGYHLKSPLNPVYRGSHVSLGHPEGMGIDLALINDHHIIPDFRAPDNIRLGVSPLYTTYEEIYRTVLALEHIVNTQSYLKYKNDQPTVT